MDKKTLVDIDIEEGKKLLEKLDETDMKITSAFWFYLPDIEEWRFTLATPWVERDGPKKTYTKLLDFINNFKEEINIPLEGISLISPEDPVNKLLRNAISTGPGISGIRFSGNVINGILINDAYIYRVI